MGGQYSIRKERSPSVDRSLSGPTCDASLVVRGDSRRGAEAALKVPSNWPLVLLTASPAASTWWIVRIGAETAPSVDSGLGDGITRSSAASRGSSTVHEAAACSQEK